MVKVEGSHDEFVKVWNEPRTYRLECVNKNFTTPNPKDNSAPPQHQRINYRSKQDTENIRKYCVCCGERLKVTPVAE